MGASDSAAPMVEAPTGPVAPQPGEVEGQAADQSAASAADPDAADRSVVTTGWASITVDDPIASAEDAATIAEDAGGRVDNRTETPGTDAQPPSASLTLRVPADQVDDVVDELRTLGTVNSVSMNASDVTQQRQDLDARIEALSVSVDRLTELLATATTVSDLIAIESELTTRQAELDSLTQQRDSLVDHGSRWFAKLVGVKVRATETAKHVVDQAVRVSGGSSYFSGSELGRLYRDVLAGIFHPSDDESAHSIVANAWLGPLD